MQSVIYMGSSTSQATTDQELTQDKITLDYPVIKPSTSEIKGLEVGDEVFKEVDGIAGCLVPGIFYHNGIYVGNGGVVSKYRDENDHSKGLIKLESIRGQDWVGFQKKRSGGLSARNKAILALQEFYQTPTKESYHLMSNNCQHFTDYCLGEGIGSRPRENPPS